jgi:DNA polymerase (family 10)
MPKPDVKSTSAPPLKAPLHNMEIADRFDDIATMLELGEANPFRVRAYRNASRLLRRYGREVSEMEADALAELPGIGEDLAGKICELCKTGTMPMLEELKASTPPVALELMQIPGLGPKRIGKLVKKFHLHSIQELQNAARDKRIRRLKGFGAKIESYLLEALEARKLKSTRVPLATASAAARPLLAYLKTCAGVTQTVVGGSYRRGQETVGDLDFLVAAERGAQAIGWFTAYPEFVKIEAAGTTRATAFLRSGLQVDLRVVAPQSFGAALHYFTGSKAHNIAVRGIGRERGLKINEYGVFRGRRRIAGKTEEEVFASAGLPYIEPELRENRGEIEAAREGRLPKLVTLADLKGDLHVHSDHTDGTLPIRDMALAAKARGFSYIAMTDHSRRVAVTGGLDPARLRREIAEIDRLNEEGLGIHVLKGIEVDILPDGTLDMPDAMLAKLDMVVAAIHSNFNLSRDAQTERIEKALAHPMVTVLAHPTGRMLGTREAYEVDMARIMRAAAAHGVALEVNAQPDRLDLNDVHCRMAKESGLLLSIDSDAHAAEDYDNLAYGVAQARRGWLEANNVLNTLPLAELRAFLAGRRERANLPGPKIARRKSPTASAFTIA